MVISCSGGSVAFHECILCFAVLSLTFHRTICLSLRCISWAKKNEKNDFDAEMSTGSDRMPANASYRCFSHLAMIIHSLHMPFTINWVSKRHAINNDNRRLQIQFYPKIILLDFSRLKFRLRTHAISRRHFNLFICSSTRCLRPSNVPMLCPMSTAVLWYDVSVYVHEQKIWKMRGIDMKSIM